MRGPLPVCVVSVHVLRPRCGRGRRRRRGRPAAPGWPPGRARSWRAAGVDSPPGMRRLPGRRTGRPVSVCRAGGVASTRSAASQPASTSVSAHGRSPESALSQLDRSDRKIGVSSSSIDAGVRAVPVGLPGGHGGATQDVLLLRSLLDGPVADAVAVAGGGGQAVQPGREPSRVTVPVAVRVAIAVAVAVGESGRRLVGVERHRGRQREAGEHRGQVVLVNVLVGRLLGHLVLVRVGLGHRLQGLGDLLELGNLGDLGDLGDLVDLGNLVDLGGSATSPTRPPPLLGRLDLVDVLARPRRPSSSVDSSSETGPSAIAARTSSSGASTSSTSSVSTTTASTTSSSTAGTASSETTRSKKPPPIDTGAVSLPAPEAPGRRCGRP